MGIGDQLMAAGRAKLLHRETGKRIAIGRYPRILWSELYENNPYLVKPTELFEEDMGSRLWLEDCSGKRPYINYVATICCKDNKGLKRPFRWIWVESHRAEPAEIFLSLDEMREQQFLNYPYVLIEPNLKRIAPDAKRWPFEYYQEVVDNLPKDMRVIQPTHNKGPILKGVEAKDMTLRQFVVYISRAALLITNEGLPNHIAACFKTPTIAMFGGFIDPVITGYPFHHNFYVKDDRVTGVRYPTAAGKQVMKGIKPEQVMRAVKQSLHYV